MTGETDKVYEGTFVAHGEIAHFVIARGGVLGLFRHTERWELKLPATYVFPGGENVLSKDAPVRYFRMRLRGTLGPVGQFGPRGMCTRRLTVAKVLTCTELDRPDQLG